MIRVKFKVACTAVYDSELKVPNEIADDKEAILEYIHDHLDECNVQDLEWIGDLNPDAAVMPEDIYYIGANIVEVRATEIQWDLDDESDITLPTEVIIPEDVEEDNISDWLSDEYGFCIKGYSLISLTGDDIEVETEKLKRAVFDAGVDAVEEFLGHLLDSDDIDIWSEMDDALVNMPDEVYLEYLAKYCR